MKSKNNYQEKDYCSFCHDVNKAMKKTGKKEDKKESSWNLKKSLLIIGLLLAVFGAVKLGMVFKTKAEALQTNQPQESLEDFQADNLQIDSLAFDFVAEDVDGNKISLSDFRNQKPVLLIFWATWCGYCAQELPDLKTFTKKHENEIQVITVASGESKETIKNYIREKEVNFLMLLDETKKIWNQYLVRGTPSHFLIDKEGKIVTLRPGLSLLKDLETMFSMLK